MGVDQRAQVAMDAVNAKMRKTRQARRDLRIAAVTM
jgi:hypothetical protein